jgi:hypothetical protein
LCCCCCITLLPSRCCSMRCAVLSCADLHTHDCHSQPTHIRCETWCDNLPLTAGRGLLTPVCTTLLCCCSCTKLLFQMLRCAALSCSNDVLSSDVSWPGSDISGVFTSH